MQQLNTARITKRIMNLNPNAKVMIPVLLYPVEKFQAIRQFKGDFDLFFAEICYYFKT